ncbi:MAG: hypothetical protein GIX01_02365 [Candidatus Eremiobacteraeota bacterium]|nr:hypothetical protein [Candidatus Eremiobacteraeota bacterium]
MLVLAVAVLGAGGAGLARASVQTIDELTSGALVPSAAPSLLGPIDALGRVGWDCIPERTARTASVRDARLPDASGR